ncbi:MAG: DUF2092 domain-containing protein [Xanthomonadaceae bacterium]|jgi:hypothetical protein|nr:DUF2092 domain-containing protein [Xanthomonadaceae bacterium]
MSIRHAGPRLLLSAILIGLAAPAFAQEAASSSVPQPTGRVFDQYVSPEAQAVLDRMTTYLRGLESFTIEATGTRDEVVAYGYKIQNNESATLSVQRPNRLRAEVRGDLRDWTFVYDGSKVAMHSGDDDAFTTAPVTANLGQLVGRLLNAGVELPLIDVLYQAFTGTLIEAVRGGILVGESTIDGSKCDQLAFRQANIDWQLWVEQGARALPRKIVITTRYAVGDPQFQAVMRWNLQPKFDANTFVFTPPQGAREIPFREAAALQEGNE